MVGRRKRVWGEERRVLKHSGDKLFTTAMGCVELRLLSEVNRRIAGEVESRETSAIVCSCWCCWAFTDECGNWPAPCGVAVWRWVLA